MTVSISIVHNKTPSFLPTLEAAQVKLAQIYREKTPKLKPEPLKKIGKKPISPLKQPP